MTTSQWSFSALRDREDTILPPKHHGTVAVEPPHSCAAIISTGRTAEPGLFGQRLHPEQWRTMKLQIFSILVRPVRTASILIAGVDFYSLHHWLCLDIVSTLVFRLLSGTVLLSFSVLEVLLRSVILLPSSLTLHCCHFTIILFKPNSMNIPLYGSPLLYSVLLYLVLLASLPSTILLSCQLMPLCETPLICFPAS